MKIGFKKQWPLAGIGILMAVVIFFMHGAEEGGDNKEERVEPLAGEGLKLKNIHFTEDSSESEVKWELFAKEVKFSQNRQFLTFWDFTLKLKSRDKPGVALVGRRGDYNKESGEITLREGLQGETENGFSMTAEHLLYNQQKGTIHSEKPVRIFGPSISVSGNRLHLDIEEEILTLGSGVTTFIRQDAFTS